MVRTSGGIKISSGKSSKKGGGSSSSSRGTSASTSSTKSSSRLPPIPHQETPSWQKPITNFFHSGHSSSKKTDSLVNDDIIEKSEGTVEEYIEAHSDDNKANSDNANDNQKLTEESSKNKELKECNTLKSLEVAIENDQVKAISNENDNKENKINIAKSPDNQICTKISSKSEECNTPESIEAATENGNKNEGNEGDDNKESNMNLTKPPGNQIHTEEHKLKESDIPQSIESDKGTEEPHAKKKKMD